MIVRSTFECPLIKIKDLALKEKQIRVIEKWQEKKIKDTYINVNQDYRDCSFSSGWVKS